MFSIIVSVALFAFILGIFTDIRAQDHVTFLVDSIVYKQAVTLIAALLAGYSMCSMCAAIPEMASVCRFQFGWNCICANNACGYRDGNQLRLGRYD